MNTGQFPNLDRHAASRLTMTRGEVALALLLLVSRRWLAMTCGEVALALLLLVSPVAARDDVWRSCVGLAVARVAALRLTMMCGEVTQRSPILKWEGLERPI